MPSGRPSLGEFLGYARRIGWVVARLLELMQPELALLLLPDGSQLLDAIIQEATRDNVFLGHSREVSLRVVAGDSFEFELRNRVLCVTSRVLSAMLAWSCGSFIVGQTQVIELVI